MKTLRAAATGRTRKPAVAGTFYPRDSEQLARTVGSLLAAADAADAPARAGALRALVVPHAGYRYSGPFAASAYALLRGRGVDRVVLIGPAHFVPLAGCVVPQADVWLTPLGPLPVDEKGRRIALDVAGVYADDAPHLPEHALEVQLPFLQRLLAGPPPVLPVAVHSPPELVADLLDAVVTSPSTLVVTSTDLSHYQPDELARRQDARTARAIRSLDAGAINDTDACGAHALRGLLAWARRRGWALEQVALGTSGDTAGDRSRVVGYGAFAAIAAD
jgi:hypothetical protein